MFKAKNQTNFILMKYCVYTLHEIYLHYRKNITYILVRNKKRLMLRGSSVYL